jgi:hypothetical protein
MKRLILIVITIFVASGTWSFAESLSLADLPDIKQGVAWSFADNRLNYLGTVEIVKVWKGLSIEAGYAGVAKNTGDKAVLVASYDVFKASDVTNIPLLKYIVFRPGAYVGYGRVDVTEGQGKGNNELDYGLSATFLDIKF